jgi:hypothetical protein
MPIRYHIEMAVATVFLEYEGPVTNQELLAAYLKVYSDPVYQAGYSELADCRRVTAFDVSEEAIRDTGEMALVAAGTPPVSARVAIVAADGPVYRKARFYQGVQASTSEMVEVFREMVPARRWLGLAPPEHSPGAPW